MFCFKNVKKEIKISRIQEINIWQFDGKPNKSGELLGKSCYFVKVVEVALNY